MRVQFSVDPEFATKPVCRQNLNPVLEHAQINRYQDSNRRKQDRDDAGESVKSCT
jgi:hypothetical protein